MEGVAVDLNYPQISMGRFNPVTLRVDFADSGNSPSPIFAAIVSPYNLCFLFPKSVHKHPHRLVGWVQSNKRICDLRRMSFSVVGSVQQGNFRNQRQAASRTSFNFGNCKVWKVWQWQRLQVLSCWISHETCAIFKETFVNYADSSYIMLYKPTIHI